MFPNQNPGRRRSNLGRRSRIISASEIPPLPAPVFAVPKVVSTGLGRSRSAKKTPLGKASKEYIARKRLFLNRSPMDVSINISSQSRPSPNLSNYSGDTLNVTGVRSINTPSPDTRSTSSQARYNSNSNFKPHVNPYLYDFSKPPLSPGPSKYDAIVRKELDSLKPPVDPGDNVHMKKCLESLKTREPQVSSTSARFDSLSLKPSSSTCSRLENNKEQQPKGPPSPRPTNYESLIRKEINSLKSPFHSGDNELVKKYMESLRSSVQTQEPQVSFTSVQSVPLSPEPLSSTCPKLENNEQQPKEIPASLKKTVRGSAKKLSVIEEDEQNDEQSFILAEQTILGLNHSIKEQTIKNIETKPQISVDPKEDQLQIALLAIDKGLANMEETMNDMKALRITVQKLIAEQKEQKTREKTGNKENVPVNIEQKWFATLKTGNPGLLKTPNMTRNRGRISQLNQSAILTPHSLSTVLTDQMEDLFSDEYY